MWYTEKPNVFRNGRFCAAISSVEYVLVIWDKERGKIAFRPITRKDARAYRVTFGPKGNYAMFSAKTFMEHIGLDYSETRIVPLTWTDEGMFETEIPIEFLKNQQQQRLIAVEPNRKSGPGKAG